MKIAIYNYREPNEYIGGIERISVNLARSLQKHGVSVIFVSIIKANCGISYNSPAPLFILPSLQVDHSLNVEALHKLLADEHIDIILNQSSESLASHNLIYKAVNGTEVKQLSVLHFCPIMRKLIYKYPIDTNIFSFKENIVRVMKKIAYLYPLDRITLRSQSVHYRKLYNESSAVVLLSKSFIQEYAQMARISEISKLRVINNMLTFPRSEEKVEKLNRVLFCSRLEKEKRPERVLYIWKRVQEKLPTWSLDIVGDGSLMPKLKLIAERLKLERVVFHGFVNPEPFYKRSQMLLMTSDYEGWGLVLTESMQNRCVPIVLHTYSSAQEIIDPGVNGLLVPNASIKKMSNCVLSLAKNEKKRFQMAQSAFISTQRFSNEKITNDWISLFNEIRITDKK